MYVNNANSVLRLLKNHGLIVFILTYIIYALVVMPWVCRSVIRCGTVDEV